MKTYPCPFLADQWAHETYYQWRLHQSTRGLKVLSKRYGPIQRWLLIARGSDDAAKFLSLKPITQPRAQVIVRILDEQHQTEFRFGKRTFRQMPTSKRILNDGTFVFDLSEPEETLRARMGKHTKRKIQESEKDGLTVRFEHTPKDIDVLMHWLSELSKKQGIHIPSHAAVESMLRDRRALLAIAETHQQPKAAVLVYVCNHLIEVSAHNRTGFFLYGGRDPDEKRGASHAIHWHIAMHLKQLGFDWYDFGGAPPNISHGIYRFKKDFGAPHVSFGREYVWTGAPIKAILGMKSAIKSLVS